MDIKELSKINDALSSVNNGDNAVNPEDKDYYDGKLMQVSIWLGGGGYCYKTYQVYETDEEGALDKVIAYLEKRQPDELEVTDKHAMELRKELAKEHNLEDEWEAEELPEFYENYMYVDATMEGANEPHYISSENLCIERLN